MRLRVVLSAIGVVALILIVLYLTFGRRHHHVAQSGLASLMFQGGAYYGGTTTDQAAMLRFGLTYTVETSPGELPSPPQGMHYIDEAPLIALYHHIPPSCRNEITPCAFPKETESLILSEVRRRLAAVRNNPNITAYYVLDDYPGNVKQMLERIHSLVVRANRTSVIRRPTVCAFAAPLDVRAPSRGWITDLTPFSQALLNFSPKACDAVAVYSYAPPNVLPVDVDWSMSLLLPAVRTALLHHGWNPSRQPLIGVPQTFGFPSSNRYPPPAADIETETKAFCRGGARSVLAYAWTVTHDPVRNLDLRDDPQLRVGLARGLAACKGIWHTR